jgi:hypothetical protein
LVNAKESDSFPAGDFISWATALTLKSQIKRKNTLILTIQSQLLYNGGEPTVSTGSNPPGRIATAQKSPPLTQVGLNRALFREDRN